MADKGQLLERMVIIPGPRVLDGIYLNGPKTPPLLVCGAHPEHGGSVEHPIPNEAAWAAAYAGHASLRFFWRGVGASEGHRDPSPDATLTDLLQAAEHLLETTAHPRLTIAAHHFGIHAALLAAAEDERVERIILIAPPATLIPTRLIAHSPKPTLIIVGSEDASADHPGLRAATEADSAVPRRMLVIPGADHTFRKGLSDVGRAVAAFLTA